MASGSDRTRDSNEAADADADIILPTSRPCKGRGAAANPQNRFSAFATVALPDPDASGPKTEYLRDTSKHIIAFNDSPDVGFRASLNPYRGCEHGCIYCYARPSHEYLGFSAGLDFESKIVVKENAPELLRAELSARNWQPQLLAMSGVTDCYQPLERRLELTRRCLQVLAEFRNPVAIVTKNFLVTRDRDYLSELAGLNAAAVIVSLTTLNTELARTMEPRASTPQKRLEAVTQLRAAGIPVGVNLAPIIPGLTDEEIPALIEAAAQAGAQFAHFLPVRLPHGVKDLFADWLQRHYPDRKNKVLNRIRDIRGNKLNDPRFGTRMHGEGVFAEQMAALFHNACRKFNLTESFPAISVAHFRAPTPQLSLL